MFLEEREEPFVQLLVGCRIRKIASCDMVEEWKVRSSILNSCGFSLILLEYISVFDIQCLEMLVTYISSSRYGPALKAARIEAEIFGSPRTGVDAHASKRPARLASSLRCFILA